MAKIIPDERAITGLTFKNARIIASTGTRNNIGDI